MVLFHAEIDVKKETRQGLVKLYDMGSFILNITIDVPDFDSALVELQNNCKQVLAAHLQQEVDTIRGDKEARTSHIIVTGVISGLRYHFTYELTDELYRELRAKKDIPKPKLDEESLKHDIDYGITMLRSASSPSGDKAWITNPTIVWQYYILQKHFGIPVPEELREQANNLPK